MGDGTPYSFTSIWYADDTTAGGSCAFWMTDSERGMVRVAADGSVLLPFYAAAVDPADKVTAVFTGMAEDAAYVGVSDASFVLLDTSTASTTKLWRFLPSTHTDLLLNVSYAGLGPNIVGVAVHPDTHWIYLSDTRTNRVVVVSPVGEWYDAADTCTDCFDFVEPAGLYYYADSDSGTAFLFVTDSGYNETGGVILLDADSMEVLHIFFNDTTTIPRMYRPLSVTVDSINKQLYVRHLGSRIPVQYQQTTIQAAGGS